MKRTTYVLLASVLLISASLQAADLYRVAVADKIQAAALRSTGVDGVLRLSDGFLVLADSSAAVRLALTKLPAELLMSEVTRDEIGLEIERGGRSTQSAVVATQGGIPVVRIPGGSMRTNLSGAAVMPLVDEHVKIEYLESRYSAEQMLARLKDTPIPLTDLIYQVSKDSLKSYERSLASFYPRFPGTPTQNQARDWLAAKFASFGADSVAKDSFGLLYFDGPLPGFNVVAVKFGQRFPKHYLIVGAHRDAAGARDTRIPVPGADDNGSGTVGVLEIARILCSVETDMSIVFALFDAEEEGLFGAKALARTIRARGDSVVCMLNLDMIGDENNLDWARLHSGQQSGFADLFAELAESLLGLHCEREDVQFADHLPFYQAGYEIAYLEEYNFSTVYHTADDDTNHLSFDYLTLMTQASLAALYAANATAWPSPTLSFSFPYGTPSRTTPGRTSSFAVSVHSVNGGVVVAGSATLHYSLDDGSIVTVPLTSMGGNTYRVTLPAMDCGTRIRYYITADETTRGTISDVDTAIGRFALSAARIETAFADDFETDKGWTVEGSATTSQRGMWERGLSSACGFVNDPMLDFDTTGQCYFTGNGFYQMWSTPYYETTILNSPEIDLSGKNAVVRCAIWYSNHAPIYDQYFVPHQDSFGVFVSIDGGDWSRKLTLGPLDRSDGGWYTYSFRPDGGMGGATRLRFVAADSNAASCIEAAVDAVEVLTYTCDSEPPCCIGTTGNVDLVGIVDLSDLSSLVSFLTGGGYVLPCKDAANVDGLGIVDLTDLSGLVSYLTGGGYVLPACP